MIVSWAKIIDENFSFYCISVDSYIIFLFFFFVWLIFFLSFRIQVRNSLSLKIRANERWRFRRFSPPAIRRFYWTCLPRPRLVSATVGRHCRHWNCGSSARSFATSQSGLDGIRCCCFRHPSLRMEVQQVDLIGRPGRADWGPARPPLPQRRPEKRQSKGSSPPTYLDVVENGRCGGGGDDPWNRRRRSLLRWFEIQEIRWMWDYRLEPKKRPRRWIGGKAVQSRFPISSPAKRGYDGIRGLDYDISQLFSKGERKYTNLIVKSSRRNAVESRCLQGTLAATDGLDSCSDIVSGVLTISF